MSKLDVNDDKIHDKLNAKSCPPAVKSCDGEYSVAISTLWSCNISKSTYLANSHEPDLDGENTHFSCFLTNYFSRSMKKVGNDNTLNKELRNLRKKEKN